MVLAAFTIPLKVIKASKQPSKLPSGTLQAHHPLYAVKNQTVASHSLLHLLLELVLCTLKAACVIVQEPPRELCWHYVGHSWLIFVGHSLLTSNDMRAQDGCSAICYCHHSSEAAIRLHINSAGQAGIDLGLIKCVHCSVGHRISWVGKNPQGSRMCCCRRRCSQQSCPANCHWNKRFTSGLGCPEHLSSPSEDGPVLPSTSYSHHLPATCSVLVSSLSVSVQFSKQTLKKDR